MLRIAVGGMGGSESTAGVIYAAIMSGQTGSQSFEMKETER